MARQTQKNTNVDRRPTIYSIARELEVSPSSVSRALTRPDLVNEVALQRILAKVQEVGYRPNRAARGLSTGMIGMIGLVIPDITNPFFPPLVRAIQIAVGLSDLSILLVDCQGSTAKEVDLIQRLQAQVDGLILASPRADELAILDAAGTTPTVTINRSIEGTQAVLVDGRVAIMDAGLYLERLDHQVVALISGPKASWATEQRNRAVREWAAARPVTLMELGNFEASYDGGRLASRKLFESGATAAFTFDDLMACGVMAGLAEQGRRVPDDVSLIGYDDVLLARTSIPRLTTVTAPIDRVGSAAVDALIPLVKSDVSASTAIVIEALLVIRESTAARSRE